MNLRITLTPAMACIVGTLALSDTANAQERQFRQLDLVDGRTVRAEVLATESNGLRMRTPQGEMLISFELLMDMVPIELAIYEDQQPERLWLSMSEPNPGLEAIFKSIPKLEVSKAGASKLASDAQTTALEACGNDVSCGREAVAGGDWLWMVYVAPPSDASSADLVFRGGPSGAKQVTTIETESSPYALWEAAHRSLGLTPPAKVPDSVLSAFPDGTDIKAPEVQKDWTASRVNAASLVPLPGYASLAQGDGGRFALGLGAGLAGTGAVVAIAANTLNGSTKAGSTAPDTKAQPGQVAGVVGIGVVSYWAISSLVSNVFGHATLKANGGSSVSVAPRPGGATLAVRTTF